ncbi:MAG TPA: hypothetical protein VEI04_02635 [Syntrophobacteria bacterium]|nr:hypothetical protein [Syntrophobacteria bacterium]
MGLRLLERRELSNGLSLEFWDESRRLTGGRWYVAVRAVVPVPLSEHFPQGISSAVMEFILTEVGDDLCFQLREERNFIAKADMAATREELKEVFIKNSLSYLCRADFPSRFVSRKVREVAEKMDWGSEHLQRLLDRLRRPGSRR